MFATTILLAAIFGFTSSSPLPQQNQLQLQQLQLQQLQQQQLNQISQFDPNLLQYHLGTLQAQQTLQPQFQGLQLTQGQLQGSQGLQQLQPQQQLNNPASPAPQQFQNNQPAPPRQPTPQQFIQQQITPAGAQFRALQQQQQPQQNLLGVAYSSAADAAKTTFNGYGIQYSF